MNAELVLDRRAFDIVARRRRAVRADEELGHQKKRDAARAFGRVGKAGEHQMHDILGHVVVAPGDEDLLAEDPVMVALGHRPGADGRQIRTRLRFGQVHRARPFAADELRHKPVFEFVRAVCLERLRRPGGQQRAKRETHIGRVPHFDGRGGDQPEQALPAIFGIATQAVPAVFDKPTVRRRKPVGRDNAVFCQGSALLVTALVEGRQHVAGELCSLLEHRLDQIRRHFFIARQRSQPFEPRQLGDDELHVLQRRAIIRHGLAPPAAPPRRYARRRFYAGANRSEAGVPCATGAGVAAKALSFCNTGNTRLAKSRMFFSAS